MALCTDLHRRRDRLPIARVMPFAYYNRLTARQKRIYQRSDRLDSVALEVDPSVRLRVDALAQALVSGRRVTTQRAAQDLIDHLTGVLGVPSIQVTVRERRPSWETGELHGLYQPGEGRPHRVAVWMRTAKRAQLVKFRTFLRTLLHELCHHLDYERFRLEESFHTEGFYKRESSLLRQLCPAAADPPPTTRTSRSD